MDTKIIDNIDSKVLRYKNIFAIPSIHSRVYFSLAVREAFEKFKPDIVAVEHPANFVRSSAIGVFLKFPTDLINNIFISPINGFWCCKTFYWLGFQSK